MSRSYRALGGDERAEYTPQSMAQGGCFTTEHQIQWALRFIVT